MCPQPHAFSILLVHHLLPHDPAPLKLSSEPGFLHAESSEQLKSGSEQGQKQDLRPERKWGPVF